jgi:hypothetical protein
MLERLPQVVEERGTDVAEAGPGVRGAGRDEALGEMPKAVKCYQQVVSYDGNPLAGEAYEALERLRG